MDPLEIRIIKHDGKAVTLKLAEKEAVDQALHALADDGYLILRKATKPITSGEPITEDLLWNKFVKAILLASQDGNFGITRSEQFQVSHSDKRIGRDDLWKVMAKNPGIVAMSCNHLGGDENAKWVIEIDRGLRATETDNLVSVEANGLDM
ncbi:MAG: hypothetical protein LQ343_001001 [Gyalolechia ehrenbergii]|nr:MAG: hypothetical protein LQ343_001001 [Gyalolechia ehrenbergii]